MAAKQKSLSSKKVQILKAMKQSSVQQVQKVELQRNSALPIQLYFGQDPYL